MNRISLLLLCITTTLLGVVAVPEDSTATGALAGAGPCIGWMAHALPSAEGDDADE